ncbi:hypothetical protein D1007_03228 [Hordeum vulgare]|nr:hypothetical protein D1007_03228 [Hordeum vulgare]
MHLTISNYVVTVDMDMGKLVAGAIVSVAHHQELITADGVFFRAFLLSPWLGSSRIPRAEQACLAFLSKFRERCFRCLISRHKVAGCREPVCCITCKRAGHITRHCPKNPKLAGRAECVKIRLGPVPPAQPLYARLRFPPPQGAMSTPAASLLRQADPARRPRESRSVDVPSPAIEQAATFLRSHAVTLRAADGVNATSPMAVG